MVKLIAKCVLSLLGWSFVVLGVWCGLTVFAAWMLGGLS